MAEGELRPSLDGGPGERFFETAPVFYSHGDKTTEEAGNYIRHIPLVNIGVFWAAKWEVLAGRSCRIAVS